jgi:hypothetical protein
LGSVELEGTFFTFRERVMAVFHSSNGVFFDSYGN